NSNKDAFLKEYPLITLLRKTPPEIGCILESKLKYKDSIYNCSNKNYVNPGNPCGSDNQYYKGIKIPDSIARKIHSKFKSIELSFEHGNLQELSIVFKDSLRKTDILNTFKLPKEKTEFPENIINISYGENVFSKMKPLDTLYTRWLSITGFDHIGAGELDCE